MQEISSPKLYIMTQKRKSRPTDTSGDVSTTTKPSKVAPLCHLYFALYFIQFDQINAEFDQINVDCARETVF